MRQNESNNVYHENKEWIGSTSLKLYDKSPLHYKYNLENPEPHEPMNFLDFGSAVHTMVFEPELFNENVLVMNLEARPEPSMTFASKANKAWKQEWLDAAKISGLPLIDTEQKKIIEDMKAVLLNDPYIREHLEDPSGIAERSYYTEYALPGIDKKVKIKVRPDWETDSAIFDYKSMTEGDYFSFSRTIINYLYHLSAAMYREVVSLETGLVKPFVWIVQEKKPPYAPSLYVASAEDLRKGSIKFLQLLTNHALCLDANFWPGYTAFGVQRAGFKFNGALQTNTKWDNEALSLAAGEISQENVEVKK